MESEARLLSSSACLGSCAAIALGPPCGKLPISAAAVGSDRAVTVQAAAMQCTRYKLKRGALSDPANLDAGCQARFITARLPLASTEVVTRKLNSSFDSRCFSKHHLIPSSALGLLYSVQPLNFFESRANLPPPEPVGFRRVVIDRWTNTVTPPPHPPKQLQVAISDHHPQP